MPNSPTDPYDTSAKPWGFKRPFTTLGTFSAQLLAAAHRDEPFMLQQGTPPAPKMPPRKMRRTSGAQGNPYGSFLSKPA